MNELLHKSLFFKKDQRCCSLNGGDFVEDFQQWIGCAQMVIGDWQFTYAMKAKSGLWGYCSPTAKTVCWEKGLQEVI